MVENLVTIGARESDSIRGMTEIGLIGIGEEQRGLLFGLRKDW